MTIITATEFKSNLGKYLELAETEDIIITKNGKVAVKLIDAKQDKTELVRSLRGILPNTVSLEEAKEERLARQ